ncbi:DNA-directed DNA polymerase gamma mip1 [Savitreella phatthalungensis]
MKVCASCRKRLLAGRRLFSSSRASRNDDAIDREAARRLSHLRNQSARLNALGIQQISSSVHAQLFSKSSQPAANSTRHQQRMQSLTRLSQRHLLAHDLLGKNTAVAPEINLELPPLQGADLDEHFHKLGLEVSEPYLDISRRFANAKLPEKPTSWIHQSGWTRYTPDGASPAQVSHPLEDAIVFDVEVMYKVHPYAVMAVAASEEAWYAWLSPWLLSESDDPSHLVPLGGEAAAKVVVGHNVGYDRARVLEEYAIKKSQLGFVDTMSLHVAVNGMCSRQRPAWMQHKKAREQREKVLRENGGAVGKMLQALGDASPTDDDDWIARSSTNSLAEVVYFHCGFVPDKAARDAFDATERGQIVGQLDALLDYCAEDVRITHLVYDKVLPSFLEVSPHPVSFAALLYMNAMTLPVDYDKWHAYIERAERTYRDLSSMVTQRLVGSANDLLKHKDSPEVYNADPWLRQLDWTTKPVRMVTNKKTGEQRLAKNQKMPGMPQWYRDLFKGSPDTMNLTTRTRISPLLLRMNWQGHPLVWSDQYGWTFQVNDASAAQLFRDKKYTECELGTFKVPHKDGPSSRVATPLSKHFVKAFEDGLLSSEFSLAKEALEMNAACSYWISSRERITKQMVHRLRDNPSQGIILPQAVTMGTITRRAIEATWMTASNAKKNRVGSELKSMVEAPPGYSFVGADVDSEELWIASLMGDSQFGLHGSTALGWMTLEGTKSQKTDLHSTTAAILGISRNDAKVFNYGRIYGAGLKFAVQLLLQFNPTLSEQQARDTAEELYRSTKGRRVKLSPREVEQLSPVLGTPDTGGEDNNKRGKAFWRGGTESFVFNRLERVAEQSYPRTPVLGCGITQALLGKYLAPGSFLTSRINWAVQSSGVDYLHLLIVGTEYLLRLYRITDARLALTVHDEIRYLCRSEDATLVAYLLQIANLWTRAMFAHQLGIHDLPQSCAFFSEVDIDKVLRKDVNDPSITPSHPHPIPPGKSTTINDLIDDPSLQARLKRTRLDQQMLEVRKKWGERYVGRMPVFGQAGEAVVDAELAWLALQMDEMQVSTDHHEPFEIHSYIDETPRRAAHA